MREEYSVRSRLEDILGSGTRKAVAKHELMELARTKKGREPAFDPPLAKVEIGQPQSVHGGWRLIAANICAAASAKLADFGFELLNIRLKRINYNESVGQKIYARMISERQQIAERFRSEGAAEAAKSIGDKDEDLQRAAH
ncbi:SPFH domain-containing protein [Marinobacter alexandrii]|uniref:SPFH domain-containing protein n=1 Tax=Marinobacter alexandrii TaxID=2570351 RepID=UPI002ABE903E|nr:SPFH domain-containing protein [Marinobacter alexandrii]